MHFGNLSVVVGSRACNAHCGYCSVHTTCKEKNIPEVENYNIRALEIACRIAKESNIFTALITSRGEPLLALKHIQQVVPILAKYFPIIEIQTNGILLKDKKVQKFLLDIMHKGLTHIAVSCVHWNYADNVKVISKDFIPLPEIPKTIQGITYRLSCVGICGCVDTPTKILQLVDFCKDVGFRQCTWRPVWAEDSSPYKIDRKDIGTILSFFDVYNIPNGKDVSTKPLTKLYTLPHGAVVFDYAGQNLCVTNCMTRGNDEEIRQLIVDPGGNIFYDWELGGAVIL